MSGYRKLGPRGPVATAWVAAADITGTGTAEVAGAYFDLDTSALPDYADLKVEVRFTHVRTGGSGTVSTWLHGRNLQMTASAAAGGGDAGDFYTQAAGVGSTPLARRFVLMPLVITSPGNADLGADKIRLRMKAKGSAVDTAFSVTSIQGRLIYTPL